MMSIKRRVVKAGKSRAGRGAGKPTPAKPLLSGAPLALCLLSLVAACAGFFVTVNETDSGLHLFVPDAAAIYRPYLDAMEFGFSLEGWRGPVAPFYFPDHILFFALSYLFPVLWQMPLYFLIMISVSAWGWMMVCRDVGGGVKMQAMAWIVHALQLALWSYPNNDLFAGMVHPLHHTGLWVMIPWLLWGVLDFRRWLFLFGLLVLFGASDLLVVAWFVLPALFAYALGVWFGKITWQELGKWAAVCVGGVAVGRLIKDTLIPIQQSANTTEFLQVGLDTLFSAVVGVGRNLVYMAVEYPILTVVWALFVGLIIYFAFRHVLLLLVARESGLGFKPLFMLVYIPSAMACPLIAQTLAGLEITHTASYGHPFYDFTVRMRYVFPLVLLPLFIGWCFLPLYWRGRLRLAPAVTDFRVAAAAAAVVVALAVPRMALAFVDGHIVSPFNAPFSACVREAAKRLGWTGAVGPFTFWARAVIDPDNPIKQNLVVEQTGHPDVPLITAWDVTNRHWYSGEFQAVIIDGHGGRRFWVEPRSADDACRTEACVRLFAQRSLTADVARATFGEPAEVVECEGIPIFHYDPPIVVDLSARTTVADYPALHPRHDLVLQQQQQ